MQLLTSWHYFVWGCLVTYKIVPKTRLAGNFATQPCLSSANLGWYAVPSTLATHGMHNSYSFVLNVHGACSLCSAKFSNQYRPVTKGPRVLSQTVVSGVCRQHVCTSIPFKVDALGSNFIQKLISLLHVTHPIALNKIFKSGLGQARCTSLLSCQQHRFSPGLVTVVQVCV